MLPARIYARFELFHADIHAVYTAALHGSCTRTKNSVTYTLPGGDHRALPDNIGLRVIQHTITPHFHNPVAVLTLSGRLVANQALTVFKELTAWTAGQYRCCKGLFCRRNCYVFFTLYSWVCARLETATCPFQGVT
jgi:hypothetical protein